MLADMGAFRLPDTIVSERDTNSSSDFYGNLG